MHHCSVSWETTLLYFFIWNFIWFGQKEPIEVQNFRLMAARVKFHQMCTSIGSFSWKHIKFQLKKITDELCLMTLKSNAKFEEKLICCFKNNKSLVNFDLSTRNSQNFYFDWFLSCKVYNVWPKKSTEELSFMSLRNDAKFEEKLTCGSEKDMRKMGKFLLEHSKVSKFATLMGSFYSK